MSKTVVGFFESMDRAQNAKQALGSIGFGPQNITVVANDEETNGGRYADSAAGSDSSIGDKIGNFFRSITGGETREERYYVEGVRNGGAMLAVTAPDERAGEAADVLENYGAKDVDERSGADASRADADNRMQNQKSIPVIEERLDVSKRQAQRGGVRVYSHVTERPVETDVSLREEHIHVERRPVDRPASAADFNAIRNEAIELTETSEEPVISKSTRVVEEVVIGKETTERNQTIQDTVRKSEVEVEQLGSSGSPRPYSDYEADFRQDFQTNYAGQGANYNQYAPAYEYGYRLATDPRYANSDWSAIESHVRADWRNKGYGSWDELEAAVRTAWNRVRGR
jgi:uncharacterized protein (TIGR02271 family)